MKFQEIKKNVFYCGLNDCDRVIFDELIPLEHGTSYNSYLVKGSEKTAIIDTMYPPKAEEYIANLDANGVTNVDYIIANHGEQDHSGSLPLLVEKYPNAKIVTNPTCKNNIMEMLLISDDKFLVISNNEELSLGDKTLQFIFAPNVHWPDTMFTYLKEDNIIFTCDFLGAHYTFDDVFAVPSEELEKSAKRYYAEIMMPFRVMCKKYTQMIKDMNVDMILPSHGPVHKNPDYILNLYADWTSDLGKNLVLLPFVSMYGSTEEMIDYLASGLAKKGIESLKYDIITGDLGDLAMALVDGTTIVMGTSMVVAGPHPASVNIAYVASILKPKAKFASFVGSYGWGGNLFGILGDILGKLRLDVIEPIQIKGKLKADDFAKLDAMVESIVEKHKSVGLL
ncbi:MAG: FprA family A-type flavoprotein [Candidatus Gastranaerophilales bacterium]|nr:FprA family A-type flavoprotein [Candidatus Gastranaerophilales bacterium]